MKQDSSSFLRWGSWWKRLQDTMRELETRSSWRKWQKQCTDVNYDGPWAVESSTKMFVGNWATSPWNYSLIFLACMLVIFMLVGWKFAMRKFCARLESISSLEAHIKAVRYGLIEMGGFVRTKWIGSWRQLSSLYSPRTKTRSLGVLNALMGVRSAA